VPGEEQARRPSLIAYAGKPSTGGARPRVPRLAYVVETLPLSQLRSSLRRVDGDLPTSVCVIVDARTGNVLARWDGIADVPPPPAPAAPAPSVTTLAEIWDESAQPPALYARIETSADPFQSTSWIIGGTRGKAQITYLRPRDLTMDALTANVYEVAKALCISPRPYCGRYGSRARVNAYFPWRVFGNHQARSETDTVSLDVLINRGDITAEVPNDAQRNDLVAHEFGHVMDLGNASDRLFTHEGKEVQEALADMFAYDADTRDATFGEDITPGGFRNWANPGALTEPNLRLPYPASISQYRCNSDEHFNSTILSHAFFRFRQLVSTNASTAVVASRVVIRQMLGTLAPQVTFFNFKQKFIETAGLAWPTGQSALTPNATLAAQQAFSDTGGSTDIQTRCGTQL
jgi:hypothetical protein